jgi:hypothetical protein
MIISHIKQIDKQHQRSNQESIYNRISDELAPLVSAKVRVTIRQRASILGTERSPFQPNQSTWFRQTSLGFSVLRARTTRPTMALAGNPGQLFWARRSYSILRRSGRLYEIGYVMSLNRFVVATWAIGCVLSLGYSLSWKCRAGREGLAGSVMFSLEFGHLPVTDAHSAACRPFDFSRWHTEWDSFGAFGPFR